MNVTKEIPQSPRLSRRRFLQVSGAAVGAAVFAGTSPDIAHGQVAPEKPSSRRLTWFLAEAIKDPTPEKTKQVNKELFETDKKISEGLDIIISLGDEKMVAVVNRFKKDNAAQVINPDRKPSDPEQFLSLELMHSLMSISDEDKKSAVRNQTTIQPEFGETGRFIHRVRVIVPGMEREEYNTNNMKFIMLLYGALVSYQFMVDNYIPSELQKNPNLADMKEKSMTMSFLVDTINYTAREQVDAYRRVEPKIAELGLNPAPQYVVASSENPG